MFPRSIISRCAQGTRSILSFELPRYSSTAAVDLRSMSSPHFIESVRYYQLQHYANKKETQVPLQALVDFKRRQAEQIRKEDELIQVAAFLHRELPVRLGNDLTQAYCYLISNV